MEISKHILSIYVKNQSGVLSQVSGLFTRRGYNIDSVAVGTTEDPACSVMTIVLKGTDEDLQKFKGQLLKLAEVIKTREIPYHNCILRELLLVRIQCQAMERQEIFGIVEVFGGRIDEIREDTMLIEIKGDNRRIHSMLTMLKKFKILEMARTGQVALAYGSS